ncbi:zinc-binding oxidoreductase CipB [Rhodotorula toruloides]|uniref:Zinc-binding oxidoreductase CipB n=1 Tax=Rhodotorula toruloides TaxID=5286 RepID=A0A511KP21_RHOTO|nr:zinc-binding oxidoreductase CipB [Rhodotorula toruloides]
MAQNVAAWIPAAKAQLEVKEASVGKVEAGHLLVKVHAVSIQPVDWKIQDYDFFVKKYPFILGTDVAGEVEEVGEGVTNVKKGDRVLAHCKSLATGNPEQSAFQKYTVVDALLTSKIPSSVSFEQATVLPLALSTAATGLYQSIHLDLPHPKPNSPNPEGRGKVILVYGGSSSVGTAAIQLAVASGLSVVTTCSPANFELVKSLGAVAAVDYKSPSVVEDLVKALEKAGSEFAGVYDAISENGSFEISGEVAVKVFGGKGKHYIAATLQPPEKLPGDVKSAWVFALDIVFKDSASVARAVYHDFVSSALEKGSLKCKPDPLIAGEGLKDVQTGLNVQKNGVSAKKVVVTGIQA